jgi:uncharacterized protein YkwD
MVRQPEARVTYTLGARCVLLVALAGALTSARAAGTFEVVQSLRARGCSAPGAHAPPLRHDERLDSAARFWAQGLNPQGAVARSGYLADATATLHVTGPAAALWHTLRAASCRTLLRPELRDAGYIDRGAQTWIMLAAPYAAPSTAQQPQVAARALELVNAARRHPQHCGARAFDPAPPLRRSSQLEAIARRHAQDMAAYGYLDHQDRNARSPAQRVRAAGYREDLVGENIAYGPASAEEVVQGWLASPGHCENLLNPGFTQTGLAYAPGRAGERRGLYWVQLLARPDRSDRQN